MSNYLETLQAQAAAAAETAVDMNEVVKGGGGGKLLPEGYAMGRLVEYVEYGSHIQEFKGVPKDPALQFRLGFALWGEGISEEDGTPYIQRTYNISLSRNEKAKAYLMFKSMNFKGTHKQFAQMLGEGFLVKIENKKPASDPNGKLSSRIVLTGFLPPFDAISKQPYPIPAAPDSAYKLFLWDHPTVEGWKALNIEGTRDDGSSKNYIQEEILSAVDFQGSALQVLLATNNIPYAIPAPKAKAAGPGVAAALPNVQPATPAVAPVATPAMPATAPSPTATAAAVAPAASPVVAAVPAMPVLPNLPVAA